MSGVQYNVYTSPQLPSIHTDVHINSTNENTNFIDRYHNSCISWLVALLFMSRSAPNAISFLPRYKRITSHKATPWLKFRRVRFTIGMAYTCMCNVRVLNIYLLTELTHAYNKVATRTLHDLNISWRFCYTFTINLHSKRFDGYASRSSNTKLSSKSRDSIEPITIKFKL